MSLDALAPLVPLVLPSPPSLGISLLASGSEPTAVGASAFGSLVTQGLKDVDRQLLTSQADMRSLAAGDVGQLHALMIRMEEGRISLQLFLQVRNRLLESYQELTRMQV